MKVRNVYNNGSNATLPMWFDNVRCVGSERQIVDCAHGEWRIHNCVRSEGVAISCDNGKVQFTLIMQQHLNTFQTFMDTSKFCLFRECFCIHLSQLDITALLSANCCGDGRQQV